MGKEFRLVIIDDEQVIIDNLKHSLSKKYQVIGFTSLENALETLEKDRFGLLILDYCLNNGMGKDVIARVKKDKQIYMYTGTNRQ